MRGFLGGSNATLWTTCRRVVHRNRFLGRIYAFGLYKEMYWSRYLATLEHSTERYTVRRYRIDEWIKIPRDKSLWAATWTNIHAMDEEEEEEEGRESSPSSTPWPKDLAGAKYPNSRRLTDAPQCLKFRPWVRLFLLFLFTWNSVVA